MTDELAQLREQVAALSQVVARAASLAQQEQDLTADAIVRLETAVTGLLGQPTQPAPKGEGEEEPEPVAWVDYATGQDWIALADWVDWLSCVYDLHEDRQVRPCWPVHLGVAEELAALHSAWREAAARAREEDGDALAFWHDRYLTPLMARINHMYGTRSCQANRHSPVRVGPTTDRSLIDVRSAAGPTEDDTNENTDGADENTDGTVAGRDEAVAAS